MTPEGKVKKEVSKFLNDLAPRVYMNMPVPNGYGESMLDYVGCVNQMFFMVETKDRNKKPTQRQEQCRRRVEMAGGRVFKIDRVDCPEFDEFREWIRYHLQRSPVL